MIISHQHQIIFLANPKTASMTIAKVLTEHFGATVLGGHHGRDIPKDYQVYFIFGVVRNPYAREVSTYHHMRRNTVNLYHETVKDFSFLEYLKWRVDPPIRLCPENRLTQMEFLAGVGTALAIEPQILHFERLEQDFNELPFVGDPIALPYVNQGRYGDWQSYYTTSEHYHLVSKYFAQDFEEFGYATVS
jgi:hypothetical protein